MFKSALTVLILLLMMFAVLLICQTKIGLIMLISLMFGWAIVLMIFIVFDDYSEDK